MISELGIKHALVGIQEAKQAYIFAGIRDARGDQVLRGLQGMETALAWVIEMEDVDTTYLEEFVLRGRELMGNGGR